jgi:hypothetical protein
VTEDRSQVIVLVHGIRDYALWQDKIRKVLSEHFVVESTNYGRFDLFRFLIPIRYFRQRAIESVWNQIRDIRLQYPNSRISFIAHSFGTYIVANVLSSEFDFHAFRVVFCGSVVKYSYPFEQVADRFMSPIINEVGAKDIWPAMAESVTWGYGSAGTYGFRRPRVRDRWHSGAGHGYFLNPEFCRQFWIPFFKDGTIVGGAENPEEPSWWLKILSIFTLKYTSLLIIAIVSFVQVHNPQLVDDGIGFFGSAACHPYDPLTDKPDMTRPRRCLPGRLSYVKWIDESAYSAVDRQTGRWPNDRANRSLTISNVDANGTPIWTEQNLLRVDDGISYWQPPATGGWTEIVGASAAVVPGQIGALLRRQDPDQQCDSITKRRLLETFLPLDMGQLIKKDKDGIEMCYRWARFDCANKLPLELGNDTSPFGICVGRVVRAVSDPS